MSEQITNRKQEHLDLVLQDKEVDRQQSGFECIRLMHRALPELDFAQLDTSSEFLGKKLSFPLLISSMTGGAADNLVEINRNLALAAEENQIALAVGSQRAFIEDSSAAPSFQLREFAPTIPLLANLGAVQLNYGYGLDEAKKAVDILQADALILHLNPLQEIIQPEGDKNFAKLADKIHQLNKNLSVPIILKEVGSGLSPADIELGLQAGIKYFDLAGRGGTSWSRIEAHRADDSLGFLFQDWGLTTLESLELALPYQNKAKFLASGGLRNGIDMIKSVIMGSYVCGLAAPFLQPAMTSSQALSQAIQGLYEEYKTAQFLLGAANFTELFLQTRHLMPQQSNF